MNSPDVGLDTLLDLDGSILEQEGGYWIKIEVRRIPPSVDAQHGIRYSLSLHDKYGTRVLGYDNAHAVKPPKKFKFAGQRLPYDHRHRTSSDKGVPPCVRVSAAASGGFFRRGRSSHQGSTAMKTIVIGVMPQEHIRARAIAIAKGEHKPKAGEPKIWFTSMKSVAEVLSDQNRALLKVIRETNPDSMAVLAKATGRQPGNLSRTLKTMSRYGLVELQREKSRVKPVVTATEFRILAAA